MEQNPTNHPQSSNDSPNMEQQQCPPSPPPQYTASLADTPALSVQHPQRHPTRINPYLPPHRQQQQQSYVVASAWAPIMASRDTPMESYYGHQVVACIVLWCCNVLFGLIAWILAYTADTHTKFTDRKEARRLGWTSIGVSISGIVVSIIIVAVVMGLSFTSAGIGGGYCAWTVRGVCYSSRRIALYFCSSYETCCFTTESAYYGNYCYTK